DRELGPLDAVRTDEHTVGEYSKVKGDGYSLTQYTQVTTLTEPRLQLTRPEFRSAALGFLNQPPLMKLKLIKDFNDLLGQEHLRTLAGNRASSNESAWTPQTRSYSCADVKPPPRGKLVVTSRFSSVPILKGGN